jgi:hypothetical protein
LSTISRISPNKVSLYTTVVGPFSMIHFFRMIPCGSMRKNDRFAVIDFSLRTPKARITLRSGKSLRSGNGSFRDSANVCCENVRLALMARFWMPRASKRLKSAFLADRLAAQVGAKSAP